MYNTAIPSCIFSSVKEGLFMIIKAFSQKLVSLDGAMAGAGALCSSHTESISTPLERLKPLLPSYNIQWPISAPLKARSARSTLLQPALDDLLVRIPQINQDTFASIQAAANPILPLPFWRCILARILVAYVTDDARNATDWTRFSPYTRNGLYPLGIYHNHLQT
ncbi:hypothetical protein HO173_004987 [Letharia columbiana]|uniref:Uncharacterized protein n=1 Tax=Letharia columbiana TaxID=112416 RepID=A0A8H6L5V8_9LECA|nr:uncharacterized protein HO173_004987 [Letharia columbiana]KAF6236696.1 hypothetical protein HO173_004987 [Letharia columbiana]